MFVRSGGTVPAQITFIIKIRYDKIMRIIMYRYYATTFFFLSTFQAYFNDVFGSGSEREGLWVRFGWFRLGCVW